VTYPLDNPVRSYAWGSATAIPELLGIAASGEPQAELWIGAHPATPSMARTDSGTEALDALIGKEPERMLGTDVLERFGPKLPFLLKVLAVERPLSIQAHPTGPQAEAGYDAENAAGVPLDAPDRSYRDRSHKPELVVALSNFEALVGFRDPADAAAVLRQLGVPGLDDAVAVLSGRDGLAEVVRWTLRLEPDRSARLVGRVAAACADRTSAEPFATVARIAELHPGDRGILLALLLQPVHLSPGEAIFVPAGMPHTYLHGVAVEAQASSDNTLRAGLTPKHVDVPEVLRVLVYEPAPDLRITPIPTSMGDEYAVTGVAEFRLFRLGLMPKPSALPGGSPWIVLITEGHARLTVDGGSTSLATGASAFVPAESEWIALSGEGTAFVVTSAVDRPGTAR
jgi:mannose-6-phosphate isomerase